MKAKLLFILCAACSSALWAQEAVLRETMGTVEIKAPGSEEWIPARAGDVLAKNGSLSTGFKSTALLSLGNSTITVRPLTRLSLDELVRVQGTEQVEIRLRAGRVRAEISPPENGRVNFSVRSPSATASVRGTVFEFDGVNLDVMDSTVELAGRSGKPVIVDAGGSSYIDETTGRAAPPLEIAAAELVPDLPAGSDSGAAAAPAKPLTVQRGSVSVVIVPYGN
ncbi:MAG: FecR domain-containing protein [Treponema sp.]|jgi:hypothetical protein|nr:FecR domain-containing protein [Treponema sp.]